MRALRVGSAAFVALALAGSLGAQAAASHRSFLPSTEQSSGGSASSLHWSLTASLGSGVTPTPASSPSYSLVGGFPATLEVSPVGAPWVTGVLPLHMPLLGGTGHRVFGTELELGGAPQVTVAGVPASITHRDRGYLAFHAPAVPAPGWQPVMVANSGGASTLPGAIGVLPLIDRPTPYVNGASYQLRFVGKQGDQIVWMVAAQKSSTPLYHPPLRHYGELDPATLQVLARATVSRPDGIFLLPVPSAVLASARWFQVAVVSSTPGYAPGSYTNTLSLP